MIKKKRLLRLLCVCVLAGSLSGCSIPNVAAFQPINSEKKLSSQSNAIEVDQLDHTYVKGLNQFAYHIFTELPKEDNIVISPYSVSLALSMLYNGSDHETRSEMAALLGYQQLQDYTDVYSEASNQYMNANAKYLMKTLQEADPDTQIDIANSIWISNKAQLQDTAETALLSPARFYYHGDIYQSDFLEDKTLENVNKWVSDKTQGMIDPFLEEFPSKDMLRLLLINAIYFNGKWSSPFSSDDTVIQDFYGAEKVTSVEMMHKYDEEYRYYSEKGMRGVEIPYGNENLVMNILIPEDTENKTVDSVFRSMTPEEVEQFLGKIDSAGKTELNTLALPKFEMEYGTAVLNNALSNLGMNQAFDTEKADFSQIGNDLYVSMVAHKAKIQVEEWGTKAAAATGITVETTSAFIGEPVEFIVNVPFIFFIREKQTGTILFMGGMDQM